MAAAWLALVSGFLEAIEHLIFRFNPNILTDDKVSPHILWVAPLEYLLVFLVIAALIVSISRVFSRWPADDAAVLICTWIGVYGVVTLVQARKVHFAAAAVFALGCAVSALRAWRRSETAWFLVRRTLPVLFLAFLLFAVGLPAADHFEERWKAARLPAAPAGAANVLILVMDTVRADHLSSYGYPRATTPNIDRWAERGVQFDNAWSSSSWTLPAHGSILTGRPTYEHGADRFSPLNERYPVLPEFLRDRGYLCGAFIANDLGVSPEFGFGRGFLHFEVYTPFSIAARTTLGRKIYAQVAYRLGYHHTPVRKEAEKINSDLLRWIDSNPGRPFFALVNYFDAHDPYWPPRPYEGKFKGSAAPGVNPHYAQYHEMIDAYDGALAHLDAQLGSLFAELDRRALTNHTIIFLVADHGESLGDHGHRQHGVTLYRELMRVPVILVSPGRVPAGLHVESAVSLQQIPATVASLLGLLKDSPFPGVPMTSRSSGAAASPDPALGELRRLDRVVQAKALVNSEWEYIWNVPSGKEELYKLQDDPGQLTDLVARTETGPIVDAFRSRLRAIFPALPVPAPANAISARRRP